MGNLHPVLVTILASHLQVEGVTWKPSMASLVGSVGKASWGGGKTMLCLPEGLVSQWILILHPM